MAINGVTNELRRRSSACQISVLPRRKKKLPPMRGIEPRPRRWERRILTTRPHGIGEYCRENNAFYTRTRASYRSTHSVKHFKVNVQKGKIVFGQEKFSTVEAFIEHFDNRPLIGDDTGMYIHILAIYTKFSWYKHCSLCMVVCIAASTLFMEPPHRKIAWV